MDVRSEESGKSVKREYQRNLERGTSSVGKVDNQLLFIDEVRNVCCKSYEYEYKKKTKDGIKEKGVSNNVTQKSNRAVLVFDKFKPETPLNILRYLN